MHAGAAIFAWVPISAFGHAFASKAWQASWWVVGAAPLSFQTQNAIRSRRPAGGLRDIMSGTAPKDTLGIVRARPDRTGPPPDWASRRDQPRLDQIA